MKFLSKIQDAVVSNLQKVPVMARFAACAVLAFVGVIALCNVNAAWTDGSGQTAWNVALITVGVVLLGTVVDVFVVANSEN